MHSTLHPILIIDDEKDNLEALQRLLRNLYDVTAVTSPFDALKLVQSRQFNVIVSDQRMPEISGVELLEKVKQISPATTRILLTGYTDIESVIGAINRGHIYRYVAKPWDPEELKGTLNQANEAFLLRREVELKNEALAKSNAELKAALSELTLLDRAKASFLFLISHELNTPLTVLDSFVSLLADAKKSLPEELGRAVLGLEQASHRFSEIVTEVLAYVRIASDPKNHRQDFDFASEAATLLKELDPLSSAKGVTWNWKRKETVAASCDLEKMRLALHELLKETLKASPSKQIIQLELTRSTPTGPIRFSVSRKGEGLTEEAFSPFVTSGNTLNHHRNLGLSLALCKLVVESHGGKMGVAKSTNDFSTVFFEIP